MENLYGNADIPDDKVIEDIFREKKTVHADDAVDYEDIDELAEEDDSGLAQLTHHLEADEEEAQHFADDQFDAMFGDDDLNNLEPDNAIEQDIDLGGVFEDTQDQQMRKAEIRQKVLAEIAKLEKKRVRRNIRHYFPSYSRDKRLDFFKFFLPKPMFYKYKRPYITCNKVMKHLTPKVSIELKDQRKPASYDQKNVTEISQRDLDFIEALQAKGSSLDSFTKQLDYVKRDWLNDDKFKGYSKDLILSTADWDDDAIINGNYTAKPIKDWESNSEDEFDVFDGQIDLDKLKLDMNDPNLLLVPTSEAKPKRTQPLDRFNLSNDNEYELLRKNYNTKQRSHLSNLTIEHSIPAMRLQTPYYKVRLSKAEARAFHRPVFHVRPGTLMSFSKLKFRKKKKDKGKSLHEVFAKTTDLTTADTANMITLEYAEQYPPILSNFGMGSKLINYYRKKRPDDTSRPKAQFGETHVLGVEDRSPFWNFGEVSPGEFVPTLYNNMVRAPIFKHEPRTTDFLLIRSQGAGSHQKYYLRPMNINFAVGNVFPVEIPAPHSRKVTNISKNRLKMIVYRVMNSKGAPRISVKDVSKHFPEQTDMQNRQRLKEFMEYQRQGDDQGFWKVRGMNDIIPTEEEIRSMITPEDSSLMDAMQFGQQVLEDTATLYGDESKLMSNRKKKELEKKEEANEAMESEETKREKEKRKSKEQDDIEAEEEMAPWNLSRNFVVANQTKAMLQLNGEGDPSGIGLGYSMLKATQKTPFKPLFPPPPEVVPKSNAAAHNQKLYEQEIKRIWYSQRSSLVEGSEQIYNEYKPSNHEQYFANKLDQDAKEKESQEDKVLRITRRVRDQNGVVQRRVETITDPRLIRAYIKRKKLLEDELLKNADVDEILPTNDAELNKLRRKALEEKLANLEKRAKQSRAKKPPNDAIHAAAAAGATIIDANTVMLPDGSYVIGGKGIGKGNSTTRRCKSCGSFGHIRTNKTCPLYDQMIAGTLPKKNM
ncbi:hypothetical protein I9W82_005123 [Candida metapsilosis]|uniref:Transcription initiation factor TFIID subunit 1 n=1 Tax=Candida metapsilosis TaxID=273372 RepID=A0A8H8D8U8_9ASCO|nr:hypothetical protein I9W82_005123 [Candida metapsilosis]